MGMSLPVCNPVGPSESREGLRLGMACGRINVGDRPRDDVAREQDAAAWREIGRKEEIE